MKTNIKSKLGAATIILGVAISSCVPLEDPGGLISEQRTYEVADFDRLEMGDAFVVDVTVGEANTVTIKGDARNLDDLIVKVDQGTLKVRFDDYRNRRHQTYITITMPEVSGLNFSGASTASVSGASEERIDINISGASKLTLNGAGDFINAEISGASRFYALDYLADEVYVNVSGASKARVFAAIELTAVASGASYVGYKGDPIIHSNTSGASVIKRE